MKTRSLVALVLAAFVCIGTSSVAWGQKRLPPPRNGDAPILKKLAELERQLSSLLKEIQELRHGLQTVSNVTVIPVVDLDASDIARLIKEIYKEIPGLIVEALPKMKCVAIRADAKTTKEIRELLRSLEEATRDGGKGPIKVIPIRLNRPGPAHLDGDILAICGVK